MAITFTVNDMRALNAALVRKADEIRRTGGDPVSQLAAKIIFTENAATHRIELVERALQANPRVVDIFAALPGERVANAMQRVIVPESVIDPMPSALIRQVFDYQCVWIPSSDKGVAAFDLLKRVRDAITANDSATIRSNLRSLLSDHPQARVDVYFLTSQLLPVTDAMALFEARLIFEKQVSLKEYFEKHYRGVLPVAKLFDALNTLDPGLYQTLSHENDALFLDEIKRRFPRETAAIQSIKEAWHRVHFLVTDIQQATAQGIPGMCDFIIDHPECSHEQLLQYFTNDPFIEHVAKMRRAVSEGHVAMHGCIVGIPSRIAKTHVLRLLLPNADRSIDAMARMLLIWVSEDETGEIQAQKGWFKFLTHEQYDRIHTLWRLLAVGKDAEKLGRIDAQLRPHIGAQEPPLILLDVQQAVAKSLANLEQQFATIFSSFPDDATEQEELLHFDQTISILEASLDETLKPYFPRASAQENYAVSLLRLIYLYRIRQVALDKLHAQIDSHYFNAKLNSKFNAKLEFYRKWHRCLIALRSQCRLLTSAQHQDALHAVEAIVPTSLRNTVQQLDCEVRYEMDPAHMRRGDEALEIPPAPAGIRLDQLIVLCASCGVCEEITASIQQLVARIKVKECYCGTPASGTPAFERYYRDIKNAVCHIIQALQSADKKTKAGFFTKLADGVAHCGIRMQFDIMDGYRELVLKKVREATDYLDQQLGNLRAAIANDVPGGDGSGESILSVMHFMREHGHACGIPGWDKFSVEGAPEYRSLADYDANRALALFQGGYTAGAIYKWVEGIQSAELRDCVLDACNAAPENWKPKDRAHEIAEKARQARAKLERITVDRTAATELGALGIAIPPIGAEVRTAAYRHTIATAIDNYQRAALRERSVLARIIGHVWNFIMQDISAGPPAALAPYKAKLKAEFDRQVAANADDAAIYNALTSIATPRGCEPFVCPEVPISAITPEYRAQLVKSITDFEHIQPPDVLQEIDAAATAAKKIVKSRKPDKAAFVALQKLGINCPPPDTQSENKRNAAYREILRQSITNFEKESLRDAYRDEEVMCLEQAAPQLKSGGIIHMLTKMNIVRPVVRFVS